MRDRNAPSRTICCPYCARRYRLPEKLIGPGGARIRCPGCKGRYVLVLGSALNDANAPRAAATAVHVDSAAELDPATSSAASSRDAEPQDVEPQDPEPQDPEPQDPEPAAPAPDESERTAIEVLDALALEAGAQLASAHARGRLFAEFGPRLLDAFDTYRDRAGQDCDPAVFRQVLQYRCGVDLVTLHAT